MIYTATYVHIRICFGFFLCSDLINFVNHVYKCAIWNVIKIQSHMHVNQIAVINVMIMHCSFINVLWYPHSTVEVFVSMCHVCQQKKSQHNQTPLKPIISHNFLSRLQVNIFIATRNSYLLY